MISFVLAFPMEQVVHTNYLLGFGSCRSEVPIALSLFLPLRATMPASLSADRGDCFTCHPAF